jgi:hypothetical protein
MDERAANTFTAPGDEIERLKYGYSLMCCLIEGMAHQPSPGTGTVMRPDTLRGYAQRRVRRHRGARRARRLLPLLPAAAAVTDAARRRTIRREEHRHGKND